MVRGGQWDNIAESLRLKGHEVIAPDLPRHGIDDTLPKDITMDDYVDKLIGILDKQKCSVILVGHSFNGITISRVAELRPSKIKSLVYLTAFLLPNGGSFYEAVKEVGNSIAVDNFEVSNDRTYAVVKEEELQNAFAHDISAEIFEGAKPYIVREPLAPLMYELEITDKNFEKIPKYYIETTEDKAIPIDIQRSMYKGKVLKVYSIKSSHTPNFSSPQKVVEALLDVAEEQKKINLIQSHLKVYNNIKFHRLFSNEDQLLVHFESMEGNESYAHMLLFENSMENKIHTVVQKVPDNQLGAHTMFDGASTSTPDNTEENKNIIERFLKDVWIEGKVSVIQDFFEEGKVIQHNPMVEDNVEGLFEFMKSLSSQGISLHYDEVLAIFAKGDMVMTYSKGFIGEEKHFFADLFRLKNGKIAEHWDVIQKK